MRTDIIETMITFLEVLDVTKEDIEYAKSNSLYYVYGQYYKKIKRIKNIIDDLSK